MPLKGVRIVMGRHSTTTDRDGGFQFQRPSGKVVLSLSSSDFGHLQTQKIPIVAGEVTEVLMTVYRRRGVLSLKVEAAVRKRLRRSVKLVNKGPRYVVRGLLLSHKKNKPIIHARIYTRGSDAEAKTNKQGRFFLLLPRGSFDLTIIHPDFSTTSYRNLKVTGPKTPQLTITMKPATLQLRDFVILAPKIEGNTNQLLQDRKRSASVSEMLGAQEMARTGDSNAASALKRVSGVTLVGGKFVYVRGLGERYSSTLLNWSSLPSPEPERRVVPLDLFPAGVLEKVILQKTYSPDMPGEFAGGSVQLFTLGFPAKFKVKLSLSLSGTLPFSFGQSVFYKGGGLDWLGVDVGARRLPGEVFKASSNSPLTERDMFSQRGYTAQELEKFGELMPRLWNTFNSWLPPGFGVSGSLGNSFALANGWRTGFYLYLTYGNDWDARFPDVNIYTLGKNGKLELAHNYKFRQSQNTIKLSTIGVWGLEFNKTDYIRLTVLLNRITSNETRIYEGVNRDVGSPIRVTRLRWIEQMLSTQQLRGVHTLSSLWKSRLSWRYTFSLASRFEPDRREIRFDREPNEDVWLLSDRPEGNQRVFSNLLDFNHDVGLDWKLPFSLLQQESFVKLGFNLVFKNRGVDTRRYKYLHKGQKANDQDILQKTPDEIFSPGNIGQDGFTFGEITRPTDNYTASQQLYALYALTTLNLGKRWQFSGGARLEASKQNVLTFELFNPDNKPVLAELSTIDVLPAALLTYSPNDVMKLRAAYSRTVSRPDFRELSPATFNDVTGGRQVFGNPNLKRALIHNLDLRLEWYPKPGNSVSIGVFYKNFQDPIETIVVVSAQLSVTYDNAKGANNLGAELDWRVTFDFVNKALRDLYFAGNVTFVWSRVEIDEASGGIQTSNSRALQGQSPFVLNVQLGYDSDLSKI
jgi:outer membrane receptor protein involved in Fe transport